MPGWIPILCGSYSVLNIDKKANLDFEGLLTLGCKGHFPNSKLESRLCVGKNATLKVMGDFEVEYDCDIEVFDRAELIIQGKKYVKSDANAGLTIVCGERIELGADVGIGRNVHIRDTNGNHYLNTTGYRTTRPVSYTHLDTVTLVINRNSLCANRKYLLDLIN